jgi:hypothetical protein
LSLQYDPSATLSTAGNALSSGSLAASASTTFTVDFSANTLGGFVQCWNTGGGTVAGTNGLQVQAFSTSDTTPNYDTIAFGGINFTIPTTASTAVRQSFFLPTGKYQIKFTNLDASNAITVEATSAAIS